MALGGCLLECAGTGWSLGLLGKEKHVLTSLYGARETLSGLQIHRLLVHIPVYQPVVDLITSL
jgi:hypothetical protein